MIFLLLIIYFIQNVEDIHRIILKFKLYNVKEIEGICISLKFSTPTEGIIILPISLLLYHKYSGIPHHIILNSGIAIIIYGKIER